MKKNTRVIVCVVIMAVLTISCVREVDTGRDERMIRNLIQHEVAAANRGDVNALVDVWTDDGVRMQPNGPVVVGKEALAAQYGAIFEYVSLDYSVVTEEIVVAGEWAFGRGTYSVTALPNAGGEPSKDQGKFIDIYRRLPDGTWKYARHMWNSDLPLPTSTE